jgi:hypothetical protein
MSEILKLYPGDRVTIVDRLGKRATGTVVMKSTNPGWYVLNMGGRHGTPGLATPKDIVKVVRHPQNEDKPKFL